MKSTWTREPFKSGAVMTLIYIDVSAVLWNSNYGA